VEAVKKTHPSVRSLRDVPLSLLADHKQDMPPVVYKRCAYVIRENERVLAACEDLRKNDLEAFGEKMVGSHEGLRDEYEVSCRELDVLVDAALRVEGVYGARMMGGGFGGCTINLVRDDRVEEFSQSVSDAFERTFGVAPRLYLCRITAGTGIVGGTDHG
jgi:galactokinase